MYFTAAQIVALTDPADAVAVLAYVTDNPGCDPGQLAEWAAENIPDQPDTPGQRLTYAVACLQHQGKLVDVGGGWIPNT